MKHPGGPTVPLSEPEKEQRMVNAAIQEISNPENLKKVNLKAAYDFLQLNDLDLDENGFIIRQNGEYAAPYSFDVSVFRETESPVDNVFVEYFTPEKYYKEDEEMAEIERLHLSDLHSVFKDEDGTVHPVRDNVMSIEEFQKNTGMGFSVIMGWSDALTTVYEDSIEADVVIDSLGSDESNTWTLKCVSPGCEFNAPIEEWDGEPNAPVCPTCGENWKEEVTWCNSCDEWHRGIHFGGESIYATPICPNCGASTDELDINSHNELFEK